ncbi:MULTISPECIES: CopG family transcriptional regulator [Porcipelethomonas]|uniref:CopG family transcriptional regulator n=1 Tax=Porcipelethomonas TaxID=2981643 RepID=UPI000821911C|nr:CopG family transcriptional regulator [Porcipelethomonas ammoniilytica]MCU6720292.1 ribbon-helix-helix domain-containing protein [Porcipelethomonas ammoniilytica]SCJ08164.1 Uncharacterised protein [uncultured Ruminococcus sp.]
MCSKKMGRPTDSPKVNDVKVRLNDEMHKKLLEYCEKNNITKAEAIRQGIHLLLSQDKK